MTSASVDTRNLAKCNLIVKMSYKCSRMAQYDWVKCLPPYDGLQLPDLITRLYDR